VPLPATFAVRLTSQLDCLPDLLAGAGDAAMDHMPGPGKWSAREALAHLARGHEVFLARLDRIQAEEQPSLERYRAEQDSEWPNWMALPLDEVLQRLQSLRLKLIDYFEKLPDAALARSGVHSRFGEMTVIQWLEFFLLHEDHHLYSVFQRVREASAGEASASAR
jgi:uncharacterized damage-inducible protein DinB